MYYMKLECGTFTFRPPDHAEVTADGYTWQMDAEDRARLECDISDLDGIEVETDEMQELAEAAQGETERADEAIRAANRADDVLLELIDLVEGGEVPGEDLKAKLYNTVNRARTILGEVI